MQSDSQMVQDAGRGTVIFPLIHKKSSKATNPLTVLPEYMVLVEGSSTTRVLPLDIC